MLTRVCLACGETKPLEEFLVWNKVGRDGRPRVINETICKNCQRLRFNQQVVKFNKPLRLASRIVSKPGEIPLSDLGLLAELDLRGWDIRMNDPVRLPMLFLKKYFQTTLTGGANVRATNIESGYWTITLYSGDKATTYNKKISNLEFFEELNRILI